MPTTFRKKGPKAPPPPPKTRPGVPISPYAPKVSAPGARTSVYPPASRPLPKVAAKPTPTPAPVIKKTVAPPTPVPAPTPTPVRPQPVGPKSLPPPPPEMPEEINTFVPEEINTFVERMPGPEMQEPTWGPPVPPTTPKGFFKRGGFVKKADGIAKRGKTKGRYV